MSALRRLKGSNAMEPEAVLAVTMGDPSGIGPELIFRAWMMRHERPGASSFAAVADP